MPATKSFRSGTWASTLFADDQVGAALLGDDLLRASSQPKNATRVRTPSRTATSATFAAGSTPRTGMPQRDEIAQQVAVVARQLDDRALGIEAESLDDLLGVLPGVLEPRLRIRREIGILGEDRLGPHVLLQLDEEAPLADEYVQRIEGSIWFSWSCAQVTLAERRHAEVHERVIGVARRRSGRRLLIGSCGVIGV